MNILLIGMPTSGKSTVGVILAKMKGMDFLDTDLLIQSKTGERLSEIIETEGTTGFLKVEESVCSNIFVDDTVIATGGSVVYSEAAMKSLKRNAITVYLQISLQELKQRLRETKQRGVVLREGESIEELYAEREELYRHFADVTVSEEGLTLEKTVCVVMEMVP